MTNEINYLTGDATNPVGAGPKILVHICNDIGGWGKGFVMAISNRWKAPEAEYRKWYQSQREFALGNVQFVPVSDDLTVANMIGQHKTVGTSNVPPIRYDAVETCLLKVAQKAKELGATVHMPKIGAGLAGGDWKVIEAIIKSALIDNDISVTVYEFK